MQSLTQPTLLLKPFAESGDKNSIPSTNTDAQNPQLADLTNGFPPITSEDPSDGGLPPERKDLNGLGYLTTTYDFFYQAGGTFTYNETIANAINGYPIGARLWYVDNDGIVSILRSTVGNNKNNFLLDSTVIGEVGSGKPWVIDRFRGIKTPYVLFDTKWADYELNSQEWLRADTFSWQNGITYSDAYQHLVADYNGGTSKTETVGSYTITYRLASDGHKIALANQETAVSNIYNESGVAWYYILDTTNQRFKLPRENPAREELIQILRAKGNGQKLTFNEYSNTASSVYLSHGNATGNEHNQLYANNIGILSVSTDSTKSGIISSMTDSTSVYKGNKYLYFYVGQYSQSATEQTAGLNASLFNGKVDLDFNNMNPSQSARQTIVGWGIPDVDSSVSITSPYTPTKDGIIIVQSISGYSNCNIIDNTTGVILVRCGSSDSSSSANNMWAIVSAGREYAINSSGGVQRLFIPFKGV